ncbi:hypothetical protein [Ornithinibacillus halotolerans]|uniref:Uncharacterized protein n=1 Tax=Ornithinibacillus halotolerans TaxID=1274357 RepID=A0A916S4A4_9BACI|nr:hypothetical protein [Ornithinibacillus halotolerans]GGA83450.1 hypothetical protein GCM10008025_28260 [Ornithinibacillus halotolerans]
MEYLGNKNKYKKMIIVGAIISLLAFIVGIVTQGDGFQIMNAFLFALGGGAAGGLIGVPLVYLTQPVKKIVVTNEAIHVVESKKPKVIRLEEIKKITLMKNGIRISYNKGRLIISGMHGYPLKDIYNHINSKLSA